MTRDSLKRQIEEQLARSGQTLATLTPATGLDLILRFFQDHPNIGDVSCIWGQVTRYGPTEDGFQITCWFANEEPSYPTVVLAFRIGAAGDLPFWQASCPTPDQIDTFRASVEAAVPFQIWGRSRATAVTLYVADFDYAHAHFDCWGVRDPERPIVSMTAAEWATSSDVGLMLRWFRQEWRGEQAELNRLLRGYCLAGCRRIWPLLTFAESRQGVEVAERHLRGEATDEEYRLAEYNAEGAAFAFSYDEDRGDREQIRATVAALAAMPPLELAKLLQMPHSEDDLSPRGLLAHAAYFADMAMCYPCHPAESIERYSLFLSAPLLREWVGSPPNFAPRADRR